MAKVKVEWTIEVTETYTTEMEWEDFAQYFDGEPPALEAYQEGQVDMGDVDSESLADLETEEKREFVSVDERYISSIDIIAA